MIVFDLECICGCQFEGWFSCRTDYEQQRVDGLIGCPQCGSDEIHKILSPVAIHSGSSFPCVPAKQDEQHEIKPEEALRFLRSVQDFFEKNFDDVGCDFAKEALRDLIAIQDKLVTIDNIQKTVAEYYKIRVADLHSKRRNRPTRKSAPAS